MGSSRQLLEHKDDAGVNFLQEDLTDTPQA
jgi:hypothetical protein